MSSQGMKKIAMIVMACAVVAAIASAPQADDIVQEGLAQEPGTVQYVKDGYPFVDHETDGSYDAHDASLSKDGKYDLGATRRRIGAGFQPYVKPDTDKILGYKEFDNEPEGFMHEKLNPIVATPPPTPLEERDPIERTPEQQEEWAKESKGVGSIANNKANNKPNMTEPEDPVINRGIMGEPVQVHLGCVCCGKGVKSVEGKCPTCGECQADKDDEKGTLRTCTCCGEETPTAVTSPCAECPSSCPSEDVTTLIE